MLTKKDVKKHHGYLKHEPFYLHLQKTLEEHYSHYLTCDHMTSEDAIKEAIGFEYDDDAQIICASEPTRIYVVMGIARFLINKGCPPSLLYDDVRQDLEAILAQKKIRKYKRYFCKEDRAALARDEEIVAQWLAAL